MKQAPHTMRHVLWITCFGLLLGASQAMSGTAVTGAGFTTVNETVDKAGHCKNGNPNVNCNIYDGKKYVWLNGGPATAYVGDGTYFFAVLVPGGQPNPNDGGAKNLSDDYDLYTNRTFGVSGGVVSYGGTHNFANNKIRLFPYADTTNPGGVYIMAICTLADGYPVKPSKCKYDAFKIQEMPKVGIAACKFNDVNDDGIRGDIATEPLIPNWPITAFGVVGDTGSGVTQPTEAGGCTFFDARKGATVILEEGTLGENWIQTAPMTGVSGLYTVVNEGTTADPHYVVTIPRIQASIEIDFGNYNPDCVPASNCQDPPGLSVTKTAANTTTWAIDKTVDKTVVKQVGGSAEFNYTVSVSYTLSGAVSGIITLNNPSAADIDVATLTDKVNGTVSCSIPSPPTTILAGKSVDVSYSCTGLTTPVSGTNSATVTWTTFGGGTDTETVSIDLIDDCATVTDTYGPTTLGTVCIGAANPTSFTYKRTIPVPGLGCVSYDNTATLTTNDTKTTDSASATVTVCGLVPPNGAGLTMGFWQNPNGQGIIKNYCAGTNGTSLGAFLNTYNPFKDFSNVGGCDDDATYVYNIIKAATAGGDTMNAMLKAQMLATALDVYFSDPALGGNKINAPTPIGSVAVDLTKICTDAGCGTKVNASPAFGGASYLSVADILSYAGLQSNVGGSIWYGNVKSMQELAKDAFDAINNNWVFAP